MQGGGAFYRPLALQESDESEKKRKDRPNQQADLTYSLFCVIYISNGLLFDPFPKAPVLCWTASL